MPRSKHDNWTISSVKSGHLKSVICGQPTSALTQAAPVEAPSIIYEVSACLDGPRERSAPLGGSASKYGR